MGRDRRLGGCGCPLLLLGAAALLLPARGHPLLEVRVPDVLDLVVRPARQARGNLGPPAHTSQVSLDFPRWGWLIQGKGRPRTCCRAWRAA
jgi:hypothetical protein